MKIITNTNEETQKLGELLGNIAFSHMIIALEGDVGAGKTEFVKGFTVGANSDIATSPTFAIMNVYEGEKFPVYHFDFYRCSDDWEEFEEYIFGDGVALIEWSEYLDLPKDILKIHIEKLDETKRTFNFITENEKYKNVLRRAYSEYIGS